MATNNALTLWVQLLVAEHGRTRVIEALAQAEGIGFEAVETEVQQLKKRMLARRGRRRPKTLAELLEATKLEPEALALVKQLGCAYENKRFLAELWRVKRFLESKGVEAGKLRSRAAALPVVIQTLGQMSVSELAETVDELSESARGDLGIIADQILGTKASPAERPHPAVGSATEEPIR